MAIVATHAIQGDFVTVFAAPDGATEGQVLSVDAGGNIVASAGLSSRSWKDPVDAATAAVLPNSPTYANGTGGVGATLTDGTAGAVLVVDGVTIDTVGQRVLVKNQASALQNGIYELTTAGVASTTPWVLTRTTDADTVAKLEGATTVALAGTNDDIHFTQSATITTIGTDSITWVQSSAGATPALSTVLTSGNTTGGTAIGFGEGADPGAVADTGFLYTKDDAGDTELFYRDDSGNIVQITQDGALAAATPGIDAVLAVDRTINTGPLDFNSDQKARFGSGNLTEIYWSLAGGDWFFDNTGTTASTIFDLGTNTNATTWEVRGNGSRRFSVDGAGTTVVGSYTDGEHLELTGPPSGSATLTAKGTLAMDVHQEGNGGDFQLGVYTRTTGAGADTVLSAQQAGGTSKSGDILITAPDDASGGGIAGFVDISAGVGNTDGKICLAENQTGWVYFGQARSAATISDITNAAGNEGFPIMSRITGIAADADPAATGAPDGAIVYDVDNDLFFVRRAGAWETLTTEGTPAAAESLADTLAAGDTSGANNLNMLDDQKIQLGTGDDGILLYDSTGDYVTLYGGSTITGGIPDGTATPKLVAVGGGYGSSGVAGAIGQVAGGQGGSDAAGADGKVLGGNGGVAASTAGGAAGDGVVKAGKGGAGTAGLAAGAGGDLILAAREAGADNGGGGAAGGDAFLDAGLSTAGAHGVVNIGTTVSGENRTSAINLGNATDNPVVSLAGTGGLDVTGTIKANAQAMELMENSGGSHDVIKLRRVDGATRYLYINNSDTLIVDNAQPA